MNYKKYSEQLKKIAEDTCNEEYKKIESEFKKLQEVLRNFPQQTGKKFLEQSENIKQQYIQDYISEYCPDLSDEYKKKLEKKLNEMDMNKFIFAMLMLGE